MVACGAYIRNLLRQDGRPRKALKNLTQGRDKVASFSQTVTARQIPHRREGHRQASRGPLAGIIRPCEFGNHPVGYRLLKLRVLRLRVLQDRNLRAAVLPEREEIPKEAGHEGMEFSTEWRQRAASYAAIPGLGLLSVHPAQTETLG
jgi:hypothetical protein